MLWQTSCKGGFLYFMEDITVKSVEQAAKRLEGVVRKTPLEYTKRLSQLFGAKIYLKREDLQEVRSYKIRGAFNKMSTLSSSQRKKGVVAASAGNHAQGVAFAASHLKIRTTIFMPTTTPLQKIEKVRHFGENYVTLRIIGASYDEACEEAKKFCKENGAVFVHPFDDIEVITGQATVAKELLEDFGEPIDFVICPIGGGGFISGVSSYFKLQSPTTRIIGAEPKGSPSMFESVRDGAIKKLAKIDTFVDGAAVKEPGKTTFSIVKKNVKEIILVSEGKVCTTMIELYQNEGIVVEPAGALSIAVLDDLKTKIKGKTVVCVLSGGNNDILRYPEIMERSLVYQGRKHYFLIEFAQKPGQLRKLIDQVLGPTDDIVRFEYIKKNSKETGPALVGIELFDRKDYKPLLTKMDKFGISYTVLHPSDVLYSYLI